MKLEDMDMLDAIKGVKYKRAMEQIETVIRGAKGDLDNAIVAALDTVVENANAEAGTFWFYDKLGDGLIRPRAVYGGGNIANIYLVPGEGIAGNVIQSGKADIVADCTRDPRWAKKADRKSGFETKTMICVPLIRQITFGCIQLINKTDKTAFDEKDLKFVTSLADEVARQFTDLGLLEPYGIYHEAPIRQEKTFASVFFCKTSKEVEANIRGMKEFAVLGSNEQNIIIEHAREIWKIFNAREKSEKLKKMGLRK